MRQPTFDKRNVDPFRVQPNPVPRSAVSRSVDWFYCGSSMGSKHMLPRLIVCRQFFLELTRLPILVRPNVRLEADVVGDGSISHRQKPSGWRADDESERDGQSHFMSGPLVNVEFVFGSCVPLSHYRYLNARQERREPACYNFTRLLLALLI